MKGKDGWYSVTVKDIKRLGGNELMSQYYEDSLPVALKTIYPGIFKSFIHL
jgi:hypothetical protein